MATDQQVPSNALRLQKVRDLGLLELIADPVLDSFVTALAEFCETPIAFLSVFDADKQVLKSSVGLNVADIQYEQSFCALLLQHNEPILEITDTASISRRELFGHGDQGARFYAGHKLQTSDKHVIGSHRYQA